MSYGTVETLTEPRTVDGNDLAKILLEILTGFVGQMPPAMQAQVNQRRAIVRQILTISKAQDNAAPLLGMALECLTELADKDNAPPGAMH